MMTNTNGLIERVESLLNHKKYTEAAAIAQAVVRAEPENDCGWALLARCYNRQKQIEPALQAAQRALALNPSNDTALRVMAVSLGRQKNFAEARAYADQALQLAPRNWRSHEVSGWLFRAEGNYTAALPSVKAALDHCPDGDQGLSDCYYAAAITERKLKKYSEALADMNQALALKPREPDYLNEKHWIFREQGQYVDALATLKPALDICPKDDPDLYDYFWSCAYLEYQLNHYPTALACVDQAIALHAEEHSLHNLRGAINTELKQYAEAYKDYSRAIRFNQSEPDYEPFLNRARLAHFDLGQEAQALADVNRAIEIDPNSRFSHSLRGSILKKTGDYPAALEEYSLAVQLATDVDKETYIEARRNLYLQLKNYENALLDNLRIHRLKFIEKRTGKNPLYNNWLDTIYYYLHQLSPQLQSAGETIANYYPCYLAWGERKEINVHSSYASTYQHGLGGVGYLLVTDRNVRIFSFGILVKQYPFKGGASFLKGVLLEDFQHDDPNDRNWAIPNESIVGAQIQDDFINLVTSAMRWKVFNMFTDDLPEMCAALNMAMLNRLRLPVQPAPVPAQPPAPEKKLARSQEEILDLLKKLGDLRDGGVLSEADFEKKKQELLAQL